jgi:outer membrane protein assembly factor BamD (BamD/ComL family)
MKKANLVLMAALAAAGVGLVGGSLLPETAFAAAAAAKKPGVSAAVIKQLKAAQEAMTAKNWDEAWTQVEAARAAEGKTPYDAFMVDEMGWFVQLQKKDYAGSAETLERAMNSGFVAEADVPTRLRALTQLNLQTKNYAKAVEFGNKYLAVTPGDAEISLQVAQALYLQKDFTGAKAAAEKLIAAAGAGKPSEPALQLLLRSNYELKNDPGTIKALEMLVLNYPQPKYWEDLLNTQLFRTKDDRGLRALYRLMSDTNTLDKGEEFAEMGATLIAGGFPNEAKQVLERGMASNLLQGDAKTRAQVDLDRARKQAEADAKDLPNADKALATAKTGNEIVATGKLFFSTGDYARAADAVQKGLAKGGVTDADDANMLLGIAYARSGKPTEAGAAFSAVKDAKFAEIAHLWKLKLQSDATPAAAG